MSEVDRLLEANATYEPDPDVVGEPRPARHVALVLCMDARIDPLAALGLWPGEVHVLRNAGGRVTDDVVRSLTLSAHELGVDTVLVIEHTGCGLSGTTDAALQASTGASFPFFAITDHEASLREDVARLADEPTLGPIVEIAGLVYDTPTGHLTEITRWTRPTGA
jgi:carbonic anhydrase